MPLPQTPCLLALSTDRPAIASGSARSHDTGWMRILALIAALALPAQPVLPVWTWPVAVPHAIVRPYVAPATDYGAGHRGIDIAAPDPRVRAPAEGTVHFAGVVVDRPVLSIVHPGGLISSYEPVTTELNAGDPIVRGEIIGEVQPGHCSSPCLHFGVRLDGEYVSPLLLLGGVPRAVLLPTRRLE